MIIQRRNFLVGLASALAAPAIVRFQNIMPVRVPITTDPFVSFQSWPLDEPMPIGGCVSGNDLLSRALRLCVSMGENLYIRHT